jgi:hypothetical protein
MHDICCLLSVMQCCVSVVTAAARAVLQASRPSARSTQHGSCSAPERSSSQARKHPEVANLCCTAPALLQLRVGELGRRGYLWHVHLHDVQARTLMLLAFSWLAE